MHRVMERGEGLPKVAAIGLAGLSQAIDAWRKQGSAQQFFTDQDGRTLVAAFHRSARPSTWPHDSKVSTRTTAHRSW